MNATTFVRLFAAADFCVTAPLAIPGLGALWLRWLLDGGGLLPAAAEWAISPSALLFAQLAGVLGACWNGARLVWPRDRRLVAIDMIARLLVAALLLRWLSVGAPLVLALFVGSELAGAAAAMLALRRPAVWR